MSEEHQFPDQGVEPNGVGPQLRAARERSGMTIQQVAKETRISQHHLEHIESGDFAALPPGPYATGFARSYARAVGLDEDDVTAMVRAESADREPVERSRPKSFEPGDPARVPSARLGILSFVAVVLLLAGLFFAARLMFAPAAELPSLVEQQQEAQRAAELAEAQEAQPRAEGDAVPAGPVVFTALEEGIWVKFYDANGAQLMQKLMAEGESYTVPQDVEGPQLWTGRPDALAITIAGREVPRLAEDDMIMRDVPVTASALLARGEAEGEQAGAPAT